MADSMGSTSLPAGLLDKLGQPIVLVVGQLDGRVAQQRRDCAGRRALEEGRDHVVQLHDGELHVIAREGPGPIFILDLPLADPSGMH